MSQLSTFRIVRQLLSFPAKYPHYLLGIGLLAPAAVLLHQFLPSLIVADIISRLQAGNFTPGDFWGSFGGSVLLYATCYLAGNVAAWRALTFLLWRLELLVVRDIAQRCFDHFLQLDNSFHINNLSGSLVSRANKLGDAYQTFFDTTVYSTSGLVMSLIFASVILLPVAPLFVLAVWVLSAIYIAIAIYSAKKIQTHSVAAASTENRQTGLLADTLGNMFAVKSFAGGKFEAARFAKATEQTRQAGGRLMRAVIRRDAAFSLAGTAFGTSAVVISIISVMFLGADLGVAFLMLSYSLTIAQRLWEFGTHTLRSYTRAMGDARAMLETLQQAPAVADPPQPEPSRVKHGEITFQNVSFTHPDANDTLFNDFSLRIAAGEKVGLVGRSGSGKTTLTKLLLRFNNIDAGEVLLDGQSVSAITQDSLRHAIAYVPQEPLLFHRTLRENIAYGKPSATLAEIETAAKKAHAHEFISKLPQGYRTLVGERGVKLSGGQRQRIAIARAILKDAPILVLDEATSALDSESEDHIQAALWELMAGRTTLVIAHRLSTVQRLDRIVVLDDGRIVEQGSHTELLAKNGAYAALWARQSGGFIEE